MTYHEALNEAKIRLKIAKQKLESDNVEYLTKVTDSLRKSAENELFTLYTGVDENGNMAIMEKPMKRDESFRAKLIASLSDLLRRIGLRWSRRAETFFRGDNRYGCDHCYEKAEYIVYGFLCGLALWGAFLIALELLVIHRGGL